MLSTILSILVEDGDEEMVYRLSLSYTYRVLVREILKTVDLAVRKEYRGVFGTLFAYVTRLWDRGIETIGLDED